MNKLYVLLISIGFLLFTGCGGTSYVNKAQVEEEVRMALREQQKAWNEGDLNAFVSWYISGKDLRFTTSRGMIKGSDKLLERYKGAYPNKAQMGVLSFEILELEVIDSDHAILIGQWLLMRDDDRPEGYFTLLWKRTPEGWRIAIDHTS